MKNHLGIHALVWTGSWGSKDIDFAIGSSAKLGFNVIEIPLLNPYKFNAEYTKQVLDFNKIKGGKPFDPKTTWFQKMLTEIGQISN